MPRTDLRTLHRATRIMIPMVVLGVIAISAPALAGGKCISATIEQSVLLPDGAVHPAGRLTICESTSYTPVSHIHRTLVDGMPVAMLASEKRHNEATDQEYPELFFLKGSDGHLELIGYTVPETNGSVTYRFEKQTRKISAAARQVAAGNADRSSSPVDVVLTASASRSWR